MSENRTKKDNDLMKIMIALFLITFVIIAFCSGILLDAIDKNVCSVPKSDTTTTGGVYYFWDNNGGWVIDCDIIDEAPKLKREIFLKSINEKIKDSTDRDIFLYGKSDGVIWKNKEVIENCICVLKSKGYVVKFDLTEDLPTNGSLSICW